MVKKQFLYLLLQHNFFKEGMRGRVSHARGFVHGVLANDKSLTLFAGPDSEKYIDNHNDLLRLSLNNFLSKLILPLSLIYLIIKSHKYDKIVCRWKPFFSIIFFPLLPFIKDKFIFELNTISSLHEKKFRVVRYLVDLDMFILARFYKLIVMSDNSISELSAASGITHKEIQYEVIPNGYDDKQFYNLNKSHKHNSGFTLVYFGTKQPYYNWELLYRNIESLSNNSDFLSMHFLGFKEDVFENDRAIFHGPYNPKSLLEYISSLVNPILVLHSGNNQVAKSGSPMKLFEYGSLGLPVIISSSISNKVSGVNTYHTYFESGESDLSFNQVVLQVYKNYKLRLDDAKKSSIFVKSHFTWGARIRASGFLNE